MLKRAFNLILGIDTKRMVNVVLKDLYKAASTKQSTVNKSTRPDMNAMRFYFGTKIVIFVWNPGALYPAAISSKLDNPSNELFIVTFATSTLQIGFTQCRLPPRKPFFG